mmetsp:Transcript_22178/g.32825  ORF Transcript_22178/g.32825 Transcript_22178/m.32825 type:complete len:87 (-) Transcript_22178:53-313(-)
MSSCRSFRHAASTTSASSANGTTRLAVLLVEDDAAGGRAGDEGADGSSEDDADSVDDLLARFDFGGILKYTGSRVRTVNLCWVGVQ